ncbi:PGF-CTERM sorting domain-containing protein [Haloglomus halophilum]|uniref:PGF-CTERM sorting domain-containing protein n=1 Tax=Haloglomus halophilum TaxID=2962672 RepID=UPI0025754731|nr:PGF-CTERM sorting domain-containing protein [Haloglomus halophilum]
MHRKTLTLCVALGILAIVAVAGSTSALYAGASQTSMELQEQNYDGSNEPDNPDCPDPSEYSEYSEYGHDCAAPNDPSPNDHPLMFGDDFTEVKWNSHWFFYGQGQHEPGYQGASYAFRSWPVKEDFNMEYYEFVGIYAPWGRFGGDSAGECTVADTQAAGIDRGNDGASKYHSTRGGGDDSLVSAIQNSNINSTYGYFQFAGPDSFGDRNIPLNHSDSFVAALGDCWANPEEPGWYRMTIWINGTNYQGEEIGWKGYNHWQYFCSDCENRQDAIEKFGPPGTNPDNPWKDTTVSTASTATATATPTVTPTPTASGSDSTSTPSPTPGSGNEQTATATPPPTATPTPTATDTPTPTATATATETASPTPADQSGANTPTETATATSGGGSNDAQQAPDEGSPTAQSGPGFGFVVALLGTLVAALLAVRRS